MHCRFLKLRSKSPTIGVYLDSKETIHVPGDFISGTLSLTLSGKSYSVKEISLRVRCTETSKIEKRAGKLITRWEKKVADDFSNLLDELYTSGSSQLERDFSIQLDPAITLLLPPTFSTGHTKKDSITWAVSAEAKISKKGFRPKAWSISDTCPFEFHPTDIARAANEVLTVNAELPPLRFRVPLQLPQWPANFYVQLELENTSQEATYDLIRIYFVKRMVIVHDSKSAVRYDKRLLAELHDVTLSSTNKCVEAGCQLINREPSSFSSHYFVVQYRFLAECRKDDLVSECMGIVDVMPPFPESRGPSGMQPLADVS